MPDTCLDMTSHFQEIHGDSPICRHSRNIGTNYEHNYEVASGIYMKISYFFDISLNIETKQKILCDPCFHIHSLFGDSRTYFFFVLPLFFFFFGFSHQPI